MTITAKSAIAAGVLGAFWLGVWAAPVMQETDLAATKRERSDVVLTSDTPAPRRASAPAVRESRASEPAAESVTMSAAAEPVQRHVKPLLNWGTDTAKAAEGFENAEQFVTIAYAAKNTQVPFVLLKHRVLNEKQSLAAAIKASKPDLDASLEADRARLEARANLSRLGN